MVTVEDLENRLDFMTGPTYEKADTEYEYQADPEGEEVVNRRALNREHLYQWIVDADFT